MKVKIKIEQDELEQVLKFYFSKVYKGADIVIDFGDRYSRNGFLSIEFDSDLRIKIDEDLTPSPNFTQLETDLNTDTLKQD